MKRLPLLYRYLISFIIILVIPVVFFNYLVHFRYLKVLEEEITMNRMNSLSRIMALTDSTVSQMENLHRQLTLSQNLRPFFLFRNINSSLDCVRELKSFRNANSQIFDIAIFFRKDIYIYTSRGSYKPELFINTEYHFENWKPEDFYSTLKDTSTAYVRKTDTVTVNSAADRVLTFVYPMYYTSMREPDATLLLLVDEEQLSRLMQDSYDDMGTQLYILDKELSPIMSIGTEGQPPLAIPHDGLEKGGYTILDNNGNEFLFCSLTSPETGLTYVSFSPLDGVMSKASAIQRDMLLCLVPLFIIAAFVVYGSVRTNYFPIRALKLYAEDVFQPDGKNGNTGDNKLDALETVRSAITYLQDKNSSLIQTTKAASRSYILHNLLYGRYSRESFSRAGDDFDLKLEDSWFQVITIRFHMQKPPASLAESLESTLQELGIPGLATAGSSAKSLVLILHFPTEDKDQGAHWARILHEVLQVQYSCEITLGLSDVHEGIEGIPNAYMEASNAADYRFIMGNNCVIHTHDAMIQADSIDSYPYRDLDKLKYLLHAGDVQQVEAMLTSLLSYVKNCEIPMFEARRLCYDMVGIIGKAIDGLGLNQKQGHSYAAQLSEFETVDELIEMMRNICINICKAMAENKESDGTLADKMRAYVRANYTDHNFSIQVMADAFHMGVSYLSQYFKNNTGQTVIDYATDLRMEKSKELLLTQKYKLNEITEMVGYANTSSFIRRFKQYTGITPGKYVKELVDK